MRDGEKFFPGSRELVIREVFQSQAVLSATLDTIIASLFPATIKQYCHPLFLVNVLLELIDPFFSHPELVSFFLTQEFQYFSSYLSSHL